MTPLEIAMAFLIGLTVLTSLSWVALPGDPLRLTRVVLAVASGLVFQLHVLIEGTRPEHWPLYGAGLLVLVAVAALWFFGSQGAPPRREDER
jgi:hypothetical protein